MAQTDPDPKTGNGDIAVLVRIEGRVQGVWFRAWTVEQARKRGLTGWVRNRADGTVEAVFCGAPSVVQSMLGAAQQGPDGARVDRLHEEAIPIVEEFSGFEKRSTL
ncbi:acylphosphatase [Thalassospira marina]|uniref:Acylphosphatase n=1 Tax=Thalassospira marina TaxID=2048283 RepID=A0A2N3KMF4_9PROT|nr:acylphosphatase [Thalassospira marina]AUG52332.1 acylphosphatase [Thalassospira marina]PKR51656.1 acylphosphatase [Thalassospira marina]